jgi:hypothetical protein
LSPGAALIKLADKICNVTDMKDSPPAWWSPQRRIEYLDWAEAVVNNIRKPNPQLKQYFSEKVEECRKALCGMTETTYHRLDRLNKHPLNLHAAKLLRQAKQTPMRHQLHIFQLANWAVEAKKLDPDEEIRELLNEALDTNNPQGALDLIEANDQPHLGSPLKQANEIVETLHGVALEHNLI